MTLTALPPRPSALLIATALAATGCWGSEYDKVDETTIEPSCEPFTLQAPEDCDQSLLADRDNCCVQGRSCQGGDCVDGICQAVPFVQSTNGEAIDIILLEDRIYWSTGWGGTILSTAETGGGIDLVATDPKQEPGDRYTTALATDGERIYWVEYEGLEIWSVDPAQGNSSLEPVGETPDFGGWGRITVVGDRVFWVAETTSSPYEGTVWMAPKNGSQASSPTLVHDGGQPHGVAADETHVYWGDQGDISGGIYRLPIADIESGTAGAPEPFAAQDRYPSALVLADGRLYWLDDTGVFSRSTTGSGPETNLGSASGWGYGLALDQTHVYWSSDERDEIYRARRDGGQTTTIAPGLDPKGVAVDCSTVYFANYDEPNSPDWIWKVAK